MLASAELEDDVEHGVVDDSAVSEGLRVLELATRKDQTRLVDRHPCAYTDKRMIGRILRPDGSHLL